MPCHDRTSFLAPICYKSQPWVHNPGNIKSSPPPVSSISMKHMNLEMKFHYMIFEICIQFVASSHNIKFVLFLYYYIELYEVYEIFSVFSEVAYLRLERVQGATGSARKPLSSAVTSAELQT